MRAFLTLLVFIASAAAQSLIDPFKLRDKKDLRLADVNQLWRTLGISEKIRETTADGAKDTNRSFDCPSDDRCEAEDIGLNWPLLDGQDAVIRISPEYLNDNDRRRAWLKELLEQNPNLPELARVPAWFAKTP